MGGIKVSRERECTCKWKTDDGYSEFLETTDPFCPVHGVKTRPTTPERDLGRKPRANLYMTICGVLAERSTCTRGHVGALIVKDAHIISTGYNGALPGEAHCLDVGCDELTLFQPRGVTGVDGHRNFYDPIELGCQRAVHAEANALIFAARNGISTIGATMYCTHSPCLACARLIVQAGISGFFYEKMYRNPSGYDLLSSRMGVYRVEN